MSGKANGFVLWNKTWWDGSQIPLQFSVNIASFKNHLPGLSLTSDQVRFWVSHAMGQWRTSSNAIINVVGGETTLPVDGFDCDDGSVNGNVVAAVPGCYSGTDCSKIAGTITYSSGSTPIGFDLCVFGGSIADYGATGWSVSATEIQGGGRVDLLGALTHEFGHVTGVDHSTVSSVMKGPSDFNGSLLRYPASDDIEGARAIGTQNWLRSVKWNKVYMSSLGVEQSFPFETIVAPGATIGLNTSGNRSVTVTTVREEGTKLRFSRANTPLSGGTVWTTRFITDTSPGTWGSVSIAGKTEGTSRWVAAYTKKATLSGNRIRVVVSTDDFASFSAVDLGNTTMLPPSVAWSPSAGRFVLAYVRRSDSNRSVSDRLYIRTSTDGLAWTASVYSGITVLGPVNMGCSALACMLVYATGAGNEPFLTSQRIEIDSSGVLTVGAAITNFNRVGSRPSVAFTPQNVSRWFVGLPLPSPANTIQSMANGTYELWINDDNGGDNPMDSFGNWDQLSASSALFGEFALAGARTEPELYAFYTEKGSFE